MLVIPGTVLWVVVTVLTPYALPVHEEGAMGANTFAHLHAVIDPRSLLPCIAGSGLMHGMTISEKMIQI